MTPDDADRRCNRCGGEAAPTDSDGVAVLECSDCGNVLGLAQPDDGADSESDGSDDAAVSTGTVHATDGNLDQLRRLLDARGGDDPRLEADRLVLETDSATIAVTATGATLEVRAVDEE